jgi:hypothetical protein
MFFQEERPFYGLGRAAGFLFSYFLFTTILFWILAFLEHLPAQWTYLHVVAVTLSILLAGMIVRRLLR